MDLSNWNFTTRNTKVKRFRSVTGTIAIDSSPARRSYGTMFGVAIQVNGHTSVTNVAKHSLRGNISRITAFFIRVCSFGTLVLWSPSYFFWFFWYLGHLLLLVLRSPSYFFWYFGHLTYAICRLSTLHVRMGRMWNQVPTPTPLGCSQTCPHQGASVWLPVPGL